MIGRNTLIGDLCLVVIYLYIVYRLVEYLCGVGDLCKFAEHLCRVGVYLYTLVCYFCGVVWDLGVVVVDLYTLVWDLCGIAVDRIRWLGTSVGDLISMCGCCRPAHVD